LFTKKFRNRKRRSYEYATLLLDKGIGTPQPIAFLENLIGWFARQLLCK
jgi:hypothetical protein